MAGRSRTFASPAAASVRLAAGVAASARASLAQATCRHGITSAFRAMAVASALVAGTSIPAIAADPPAPAANRVWAGCQLSPTTVTALIGNLEATGGIPSGNAAVSFVVVYTLANDNNGQHLSGPNFTGPVICTNPGQVGITAFDKNGETGGNRITETTDIPTQTHPSGGTIDILEAEEEFILKYVLSGSTAPEKRLCHSTGPNVDCFRIFPSSP